LLALLVFFLRGKIPRRPKRSSGVATVFASCDG
jgi:hypothetical protein